MQYNDNKRVKTENGGHSIVRTDKESKQIKKLTDDFIDKGGVIDVIDSFQDVSHKRDARHISFAATF